LREVKGWTYGVRGSFYGTRFEGPYIISGGFKSNTTDSTITEIFKEFKNYWDNGMTEDELKFAQSSMVQSEALKYESPQQKINYFKRILELKLPENYMFTQRRAIKESTTKELNQLMKVRFPYEKMIVVIVGDKATNFEKVKKLGYEVVELDINGNPVN
jgi:zinc protease